MEVTIHKILFKTKSFLLAFKYDYEDAKNC